MCTLSWWRNRAGYGVLFNRDESRKRLEAQVPEPFEADGTTYLSPVDPDGGGTWIWVNSHGVISCLLNNYLLNKTAPVNPVSRGLLLQSLTGLARSDAFAAELKHEDLKRYMGFQLFFMDAGGHGLATWDCARLHMYREDKVKRPISSSGYLPEEIVPFRSRLFENMFGTRTALSHMDLYRFHTFHDPAMPAHSVLMCRADARTVSLSQVGITTDTIDFTYHRVSEPCLLQHPVHRRLHHEQ